MYNVDGLFTNHIRSRPCDLVVSEFQRLVLSPDDLGTERLDFLIVLPQDRLLLVLQIIGQLFLGQFLSHPLGILDGSLSQIITLYSLFHVDVQERTHSKEARGTERNFRGGRHKAERVDGCRAY